jgi:hypothetical protein
MCLRLCPSALLLIAQSDGRLVGCGYSPLLFQSAISTYVNLETLNVQEEAFRAQLLGLYEKYTGLLQERKIQSVNGVALAKVRVMCDVCIFC